MEDKKVLDEFDKLDPFIEVPPEVKEEKLSFTERLDILSKIAKDSKAETSHRLQSIKLINDMLGDSRKLNDDDLPESRLTLGMPDQNEMDKLDKTLNSLNKSNNVPNIPSLPDIPDKRKRKNKVENSEEVSFNFVKGDIIKGENDGTEESIS